MRRLALPLLALAAVAGCASREHMRALQAPPPSPRALIRFDAAHEFRDAMTLEWIGGLSRHSYIFAEPNQNVMRPLLREALANSGLEAATPVRARYGLRVDVAAAHGPAIGGDFQADVAATYVVVDRRTGAEVWRREVRTPGSATFLAWTEEDWRNAWFVDAAAPVAEMVNIFNYLPFASDAAAAHADKQGLYGGEPRMRAERFGVSRAARANYAAAAGNVTAFLLAFAADHGVEPETILPCWGSPEVEARKMEIRANGGIYTTDDCAARR